LFHLEPRRSVDPAASCCVTVGRDEGSPRSTRDRAKCVAKSAVSSTGATRPALADRHGTHTVPLEHLAPYMRGVNFALEAISERVPEDERLRKEAATYRAITLRIT